MSIDTLTELVEGRLGLCLSWVELGFEELGESRDVLTECRGLAARSWAVCEILEKDDS